MFLNGVEVFLHECKPIWETEKSDQLQKAEQYCSHLFNEGCATKGDVMALSRVESQDREKNNQVLVGHRFEYRSKARRVRGTIRDGYLTTIFRVTRLLEDGKEVLAPQSLVLDGSLNNMRPKFAKNGMTIDYVVDVFED